MSSSRIGIVINHDIIMINQGVITFNINDVLN